MELRLASDLAELPALFSGVARFADEHHLGEDDRFALKLAVEELVTNVIRHGYGPGRPGEVRILLELGGDELRLVIEDEARAYNPLECAAPDLNLPLEQREPGGLGVFFCRELMDGLDYCREQGRNRIEARRRIRR